MPIETCPICTTNFRERIEVWLLSGAPVRDLVDWCAKLDPPVRVRGSEIDDHIILGHMEISRPHVVALLVQFNREAQSVVSQGMHVEVSRPRMAMSRALSIRLRTIELLARATGIIEPRKTTNQTVVFQMDQDTQRKMLEHGLKRLAPTEAKEEPAEIVDDGVEVVTK